MSLSGSYVLHKFSLHKVLHIIILQRCCHCSVEEGLGEGGRAIYLLAHFPLVYLCRVVLRWWWIVAIAGKSLCSRFLKLRKLMGNLSDEWEVLLVGGLCLRPPLTELEPLDG